MDSISKVSAIRQNRTLTLATCFFLLFGFIYFTGCDSSSSYEAKLEDARIAIDKGNYDHAKQILDTLPQTEKVLEYTSNAIAGKDLKLDTLNIISTLDDLDDEGNSGSIDMIGRVIGDGESKLYCDEIPVKIAAATEAIELFKLISTMRGTELNDLSDNQKTQLGLLGITRIVLTLANRICARVDGPITMEEWWIKDNRDGFTPLITSAMEGTEEVNKDMADINEDLGLIELAIDALANTNDIKDDFEEFIDKLDYDRDGEVTVDEINNYIISL